MNLFLLITVTSAAIFSEARRTRTHLDEVRLQGRQKNILHHPGLVFAQCTTHSCASNSRFRLMPHVECVGGPTMPGIVYAFLSYLHGGDIESTDPPHRPLLRRLQDEILCPAAVGAVNGVAVGIPRSFKIEVAFPADTTCLQLKSSVHRPVCGCFSNQEPAPGALPAIVTEKVKHQLPSFCEVLLMADAKLEHKQAPSAMVTPTNGSKTLCAATWNVGREWDKLAELGIGSGMGLEGLKGPELSGGIDTLLGECGDASIVALGVQEGADPMLTSRLHSLLADRPLNLVANAFAMVKPWGHKMANIGDVPGLVEHNTEVIKQGPMIQLGLLDSRLAVVLTTENLLTFKYEGTANSLVGDPKTSLQLDLPGFKVEESTDRLSIAVTGYQIKDGEKLTCERKGIALQTAPGEDLEDWIAAIRLESLRARGQVVKEAVMSGQDGNSLLVVLTTDTVVALDFNPETGRPSSWTNAIIKLGNPKLHVHSRNNECLLVHGWKDEEQRNDLEFEHEVDTYLTPPIARLGQIVFCATSFQEQVSWMKAIRQTSIARAAWEQTKDIVLRQSVWFKYGQVIPFPKSRSVYLTTTHITTYTHAIDSGTSARHATNSLDIATTTVRAEGDTCMWVKGVETFLVGKVGQEVEYKLCHDHANVRDEWIAAIQSAQEDASNPTWDDYIENDGLNSFTLHLQLGGDPETNAWRSSILDGLKRAIPGITDSSRIEISDVQEVCSPSSVDAQTAWKTKVTLTDVHLKPGENIFKRLAYTFVGQSRAASALVLRLDSAGTKRKKEVMAFLPFKTGVSIALLSKTPVSEVQLYSVDFGFASEDRQKRKEGWLAGLKQAVRKSLPTTADKGGAIVRAVVDGHAMCFAACHLEANKAEKRHQQAQLMADSLSAIPCDSTVWMGDFNTRPSRKYGSERNCCPWENLEFAIAHDLREHVRELTWNHDDFKTMISGPYSEMSPLYRPTFHKRFKREGHDECATKEFVDGPLPQDTFAANLAMRESIMSGVPVSDENSNADALMKANHLDIIRDCGRPAKHTLCWGGYNLRQSCESGKCFNTVDNSHCPGYTDRIVFLPGRVFSPLNYWPIEGLVGADHTPVVATFELL